MKYFISLCVWAFALLAGSFGVTTIQTCVLSQPASRPGATFTANFRYDAQPISPDQNVFVHIRNASGALAFQADHKPPIATSKWSGRVSYSIPLTVPSSLPVGQYTINAGVYNPAGGARTALVPGPGVVNLGSSTYRVGSFSVSATAPVSPSTIQTCLLSQPASRPGATFTANFRFDAQPISPDQTVFVHIRNAAGAVAFQADHQPPAATSRWSGRVSYNIPLTLPTSLPAGQYTINAGLYTPGGARSALITGSGVVDVGSSIYRVATFSVSPTAPVTPTTLQTCLLSQPASRPGYGFTANFRWDAQPLSPDHQVFVHICDAAGKVMFLADHSLPVPTTKWSGRVAYDVLISLPSNMATGQYTINTGLFNPTGGARSRLLPGSGVVDRGDLSYRVASFQVSPTAPLPVLAKPSLNLTGYVQTFNEDFTSPLSVSARGPGTRWFAHMPNYADFGDAKFADPVAGFPFTVSGGLLQIKATKKSGQWQSGLLCSWDSTGHGFAQQYGYFEMRAKLPKGEGVWPAFWLLKTPAANDNSISRIEIDVLEEYGVWPNTLNSVIHFKGPGAQSRVVNKSVNVSGMTDDFHRYGVLIQPDYTVFYFDSSEYWRMATPPEAKVPLYLIVNLALGGGWPIAKTPDPSVLTVDYVRVYKK